MALKARHILPGGWIDVPGRGTGRIRDLSATPGCAQYVVTLDSGWTFVLGWNESVLFWPN